jgi:hypothetical protein
MPQGSSAQDKVTMRGKQANGANGQGRRINTKVVLTLERKNKARTFSRPNKMLGLLIVGLGPSSISLARIL